MFSVLAQMTPADDIGLVTGIMGVTITLTSAVKRLRSYLQGDDRLAENAATIMRHARTHDALREFLGRAGGPRSILMEGAGIAYYAVKGESPSILTFNLRNRRDIDTFQQILPHLDDPQKAYAIATGREQPALRNTECEMECREMFARAEKGWVRHRERDKDALVDEAMLKEVESLVNSAEPSPALSESCHIALKHTTPDNAAGDIIVLGVTDKFQQAFKSAHGTDDFSIFRNQGDNKLFDKFLAVRGMMERVTPSSSRS